MSKIDSKTIAKLAGVSQSTVSRVINNYSNVPESTRLKVEKVIKKYNYKPNMSARALAGKSADTIGIFLVDIHKERGDVKRIRTRPYVSELLSLIVDELDIFEYKSLVYIVSEKEKYKEVLNLFETKEITAGIFIGCEDLDKSAEDLMKSDKITVFINHKECQGAKNNIIINSENYEGGKIAAEYLIEKGHKKISHLTGEINRAGTVEKINGFRNTLEENGIKLKNDYLAFGNYTKDSGYHAMKDILKYNINDLPTAVFAANDLMAIGAYKAILEEGLKVKEDISIIGFDGIELGEYMIPSLTTIDINSEDLVKELVKELMNLRGKKLGSKVIQKTVTILERESVRQM